jgi:hypothetical protein
MLVNILHILKWQQGDYANPSSSPTSCPVHILGEANAVGLSGTVMLNFFLQKTTTLLLIIFIQRAQKPNVTDAHILSIKKIGVAFSLAGGGVELVYSQGPYRGIRLQIWLLASEAESKEQRGAWDPIELNTTSPYVYSRVDYNTF